MALYSFSLMQEIARRNGFHLERSDRGSGYELFSNELGNGTTSVFKNLDEAMVEIKEIENGINPLTNEKLDKTLKYYGFMVVATTAHITIFAVNENQARDQVKEITSKSVILKVRGLPVTIPVPETVSIPDNAV